MFTKWQQVEDWIRDNSLTSWRFLYERTGIQPTDDGEKQTRSNRVAILSDAFPGELEEKIALTRRRLLAENNQTLYGYGKRGKENTGLMYCEVRLVDELQQPNTQAVAAPAPIPTFNEQELAERIRGEVRLEYEKLRHEEQVRDFEARKRQLEERERDFEDKQSTAIGLLVHHLTPVITALTNKRVAGVDADAPVYTPPIKTLENNEEMIEELFTDEESDKLFQLMADFKQVEPRYLELIECVVTMAKNGDATYDMAKGFLLK